MAKIFVATKARSLPDRIQTFEAKEIAHSWGLYLESLGFNGLQVLNAVCGFGLITKMSLYDIYYDYTSPESGKLPDSFLEEGFRLVEFMRKQNHLLIFQVVVVDILACSTWADISDQRCQEYSEIASYYRNNAQRHPEKAVKGLEKVAKETRLFGGVTRYGLSRKQISEILTFLLNLENEKPGALVS